MASSFNSGNAILRNIYASKILASAMPKLGNNKQVAKLNENINKASSYINGKTAKAKSYIKEKRDGLMNFIKDLLIILAGVNAMRLLIIDIFANKLESIESYVKKVLKDELNSMVNCNDDLLMPDWLKSTGVGIDMEIKNIDYFGLFHTDPISEEGSLIYGDNYSGLQSKDMHTFLYEALQFDSSSGTTITPSSGTTITPLYWGHQTMSNDIATITYSSTTTAATNVINVKSSLAYDNRTLSQFNSDYIDSIKLFPTAGVFNKLIDAMLGTVSFHAELPKTWLQKQEEANKVIEKFFDVEPDTVIDNSYFTFTNDELNEIDEIATNRYFGITKFLTCDEIQGSVPFSGLSGSSNSIMTASTKVELEKNITNAFDTIASATSANIDSKSEAMFQIEFFNKAFRALAITLGNVIVSPKLVILLQLNHKIMYGQNSHNFTSAPDLIMNNKTLCKIIFGLLKRLLIAFILQKVMKEIDKLMKKTRNADIAERTKLMKEQLIGLVSIPPALIKLMIKLNSVKI